MEPWGIIALIILGSASLGVVLCLIIYFSNKAREKAAYDQKRSELENTIKQAIMEEESIIAELNLKFVYPLGAFVRHISLENVSLPFDKKASAESRYMDLQSFKMTKELYPLLLSGELDEKQWFQRVADECILREYILYKETTRKSTTTTEGHYIRSCGVGVVVGGGGMGAIPMMSNSYVPQTTSVKEIPWVESESMGDIYLKIHWFCKIIATYVYNYLISNTPQIKEAYPRARIEDLYASFMNAEGYANSTDFRNVVLDEYQKNVLKITPRREIIKQVTKSLKELKKNRRRKIV